MRRWERERVFAWRRHFPGRVVGFNLAFPFKPNQLAELDPDLIVYDATALSTRYRSVGFEALGRAMEAVSGCAAPRIAMPLDDFIGTGRLRQFLSDARVDVLLTAAEPLAAAALYPRPSYAVRQILTAYIDDGLVRLARRSPPNHRRKTWVGYRVWGVEPWLGRLSALKRDVGLAARGWADARGVACDIAVDGGRGLVGDEWIRFLGRCRATVGVEGGSSILDLTGETVAKRSDAVEAADRVSDAEPAFELRALSPRHLEAAATRTLQVLVEGRYSGVLAAGEHYIPVGDDLSDMPDALDRLFDEDAVRAITARAYDHVVASGQYAWRGLIEPLSRELLS